MKRAKLVRALFLRLSQEDAEALEKTAEQLKLSVSEIARRGIRVGVRSLATARLPGGETDFGDRSPRLDQSRGGEDLD